MQSTSLQISVIIPVYNAATFVAHAVKSAVDLQAVAEVILIEDGSKDNSLEVCKQLEVEYSKVKLFTHENNMNRGAGASRNLGIQHASFPYVAFLDADDYFLPNRFVAEEELFVNDTSIDGVYGALGFHYYSGAPTSSDEKERLTTVTEQIDPEMLKWELMGVLENRGWFSIVALTVKKELVTKVGGYPDMSMHEDTIFITKLAYQGKLVGGRIKEAVAMRGVHVNNRITQIPNPARSKAKMYQQLLQWAIDMHLSTEEIRFFEAKCRLFEILDKELTGKKWRTLRAILINNLFLTYDCFFNPAVITAWGDTWGNRFIRWKSSIQHRICRSNSSSQALLQLLITHSRKLK